MPSDYSRVERAIGFLQAHAHDQPSLETVAAEVGLSESHFQRLFRRWAGVSPKQFLQALTVTEAKRLLREGGDESVLTTSHAVGLSGPGRLHDLFLRVEAMTPGEYKAGGAGLAMRWGVHATPFGDAVLAVTPRGLCHLAFIADRAALSLELEALGARWPGASLVRDPAAGEPFASELARRTHGRPRRELGLLLKGTPFQLKVWQALLRLGPGEVASYGTVAKAAGLEGAVRAVGTAIGQNAIGYLIPCHRAIRASGALGDYRWGVGRKRAILAFEQARLGAVARELTG
jgi:AraC family transcriptional regulator of adaptative response/methylated-DNA-[protein]-cysteine methyltransferase